MEWSVRVTANYNAPLTNDLNVSLGLAIGEVASTYGTIKTVSDPAMSLKNR